MANEFQPGQHVLIHGVERVAIAVTENVVFARLPESELARAFRLDEVEPLTENEPLTRAERNRLLGELNK